MSPSPLWHLLFQWGTERASQRPCYFCPCHMPLNRHNPRKLSKDILRFSSPDAPSTLCIRHRVPIQLFIIHVPGWELHCCRCCSPGRSDCDWGLPFCQYEPPTNERDTRYHTNKTTLTLCAGPISNNRTTRNTIRIPECVYKYVTHAHTHTSCIMVCTCGSLEASDGGLLTPAALIHGFEYAELKA